MRVSLLHAGVALGVCVASGLASSPASAHVALVRGLETAAERTAVLVPGFGVAFASEAGGSYRYACDAALGTTPYADQQRLVSLSEQGWLLADPGGLHRISPLGCEAAAPQGFPRERLVAALAVAPGDGSTLYVADDQSRLYESDDAGVTFRVLAELSPDLPITGLAIAGAAPRRLYVSQSGADDARLAWSIDAGVTFETEALPRGSGLVTLQAVESGPSDRLWLSASQATSRDVAIWRMAAGGEPVTVHRVRFFGGLALGDDSVWVGDEAGGLFRSDHDQPFAAIQPNLAVSCLHRDDAGALWVCTPTTSDQSAVLVSDDLGQSLRPQLALQQVKALVECPGAVSGQCAAAWNEWEVDVLRLPTDLSPGRYPGTVTTPSPAPSPEPSPLPVPSVAPLPAEMSDASASEARSELPASDGCALAVERRRSLTETLALLMLGVVARRRRRGLKQPRY